MKTTFVRETGSKTNVNTIAKLMLISAPAGYVPNVKSAIFTEKIEVNSYLNSWYAALLGVAVIRT